MGFLTRRKKPELIEPDAAYVESLRARHKKTAGSMWFCTAASVMAVATGLSSSLVHIGVQVAITAGFELAAVHYMDESSDDSPPRILYWIGYAAMIGAIGMMLAGQFLR